MITIARITAVIAHAAGLAKLRVKGSPVRFWTNNLGSARLK
jgi:hypothetical protein